MTEGTVVTEGTVLRDMFLKKHVTENRPHCHICIHLDTTWKQLFGIIGAKMRKHAWERVTYEKQKNMRNSSYGCYGPAADRLRF
jgi:hypothetical protein